MDRITLNGWTRGLAIGTGLLVTLAVAAHAEEITYSKHIRPLFETRCASCHGGNAPEHGDFKKDKDGFTKRGQGPRMDTYAHLVSYAGWPDSGALMRRLDDGKNTKDGRSGNMYQHLGATEEERQRNLMVFKAWVGNWSLKRFAEMTKEELAGITVRY
jgi:hypothetical protein